MKVMMPVNVIGKACDLCPRLKIIITKEYKGDKIIEQDLECAHYDDCLDTLDVWQKGQDKGESD